VLPVITTSHMVSHKTAGVKPIEIMSEMYVKMDFNIKPASLEVFEKAIIFDLNDYMAPLVRETLYLDMSDMR